MRRLDISPLHSDPIDYSLDPPIPEVVYKPVPTGDPPWFYCSHCGAEGAQRQRPYGVPYCEGCVRSRLLEDATHIE